MDWIDEQIMKIQDKVRNLSLLKGALVYLAFFSGIAMILTILTNRISDRRIFMWLSGSVEMAEWEPSFWTFLEHWAGYIYMGTGMVLMLVLFYHNRLKKPIRIIQEGVEEFRKQNLGFPLEYDSRDEMGELCRLLDSMRENLEERYEDLWQTIENQRKLNAAFAHDLRTPLTVLKGYSEFLARYLPQGKVNAEKMVQVLELMSGQLERLTSFCKTMKSARSLEEYRWKREEVLWKDFAGRSGESWKPCPSAVKWSCLLHVISRLKSRDIMMKTWCWKYWRIFSLMLSVMRKVP